MPVKPEEIKYEPAPYEPEEIKHEPVKDKLTYVDCCWLLICIGLTLISCYGLIRILQIAIRGYMGYE